MKKRMRVLILVFLAGMILGTVQPALLLAGESVKNQNPWDIWVDASPFTGTKLSGPLSIYWWPVGGTCTKDSKTGTNYNMYYTVRLSKGFDLHLFQGYTQNACITGDFTYDSGQIIINFLGTVVVPGIFTNGYQGWVVKAIENGVVHSETVYPNSTAFVADISIAVKE